MMFAMCSTHSSQTAFVRSLLLFILMTAQEAGEKTLLVSVPTDEGREAETDGVAGPVTSW